MDETSKLDSVSGDFLYCGTDIQIAGVYLPPAGNFSFITGQLHLE
jgi:hypothetical protein